MSINKKDKRKDTNNLVHLEIKETLSKIVRIDSSEITNDTLIREELGIDSIMGIEIIAKIEKQFDIKIDETLLQDLNTVGEFILLISKLVGK